MSEMRQVQAGPRHLGAVVAGEQGHEQRAAAHLGCDTWGGTGGETGVRRGWDTARYAAQIAGGVGFPWGLGGPHLCAVLVEDGVDLCGQGWG